MKIAITGVSGRVGAALAGFFAKSGHEVIELDRRSLNLASSSMPSSLDPSWDVLFNPAAISAPDLCEDNPEEAYQVNALAPRVMSAWCAEHRVKFVHFSTDYVFAGDEQRKCSIEQVPLPRTIYGKTKRAGEIAVLAANPQAIVARVSWIYGAKKPGFVDSVMAKIRLGEQVTSIADKYSLPTRMDDLAHWLDLLLATPACGIVHACHGGEAVSWHGIAQWIADELYRLQRIERRVSITAQYLSEQKNFRAHRPVHTAMGNASLEKWIGPVSDWQDALRQHLLESTIKP